MKINEDALFERAYLELQNNQKRISTWSRAVAQAKGDETKAEGLYIERRVNELKTAIKDKYDLEQAKAETKAKANEKKSKANLVDALKENKSQRRDGETISDYVSRRLIRSYPSPDIQTLDLVLS